MISIDELKFDSTGLIPAVIVDHESGDVLTLAYMNRESLQISMDKRLTCFWSRSRKKLWLKGETSGNFQHIVSITADCDMDALVIRVIKDGPACHLGNDSCFTNQIFISDSSSDDPDVSKKKEGSFHLSDLFLLLKQRKEERPQGSYTSYLFDKGIDKILKKVGEECTEVIIAAKAEDRKETIYEIADLCYHVLVLMAEQGIAPDEISEELRSRHIINHKIKQEKMT